ncbi:hypothetical protein [uncultured Marixanthomonas sp.]|uniref:hypothetical protein n=1 Tax=uncultured Marixanthomonas sp. TaxID=757245 RepID=UPI0030D997EB|tara:strand:- start:51381 stop:54053 length:2673 start_codon:yes stop_codon:yes gene_type:complete
MLKLKYNLLISLVLLGILIAFGWSFKTEAKEFINWNDRALTWDDFPEVTSIEGGYDASVYSNFIYDVDIDNKYFKVYAYMNPNKSGYKKIDTIGSEQLLIHEQYHFNITEYCARRLRKDLIKLGEDQLTQEKLENLVDKYSTLRDSLQYVYDTESDHNVIQDKQRYWELYVDGLLRETAYYENDDIYSYQVFTGKEEDYYRSLNYTITCKLQSAIPESKAKSKYGAVYHIENKNDSTIISYYNNGKLTEGGYFESPITILVKKDKHHFESHFYNEDMVYRNSKEHCIVKTTFDEKGNILTKYYNDQGKSVERDGIAIIKREFNTETNSYFSSYYNAQNNQIKREEGFYYEKRILDNLERTKKISYFNFHKKPTYNTDFVSTYEYEFNENHNISKITCYDTKGELAFHIDGYQTEYLYDERGYLRETKFLNKFSQPTSDMYGIARYQYTYDIYGNVTDTRNFNIKNNAAIGSYEAFQNVQLFNSDGQITFEADYLPNYVLQFNENKWGATKYTHINDTKRIRHNVDAFGDEFNSTMGIGYVEESMDSKGNLLEETYRDIDGSYAITQDSIIQYRYKYDDHGNNIETTSYSSRLEKHPFENDVATTKWEYDKNNNKIKTTYYTTDNKLANALQNVTYNIFKYDNTNTLIERTNYDRDMQPALWDGVFKTHFQVNRFGKDSLVTYYNQDNNLQGIASKVLSKYNEFGTLISEQFYDKHNRPTYNDFNAHQIVYLYDKYQREIGYEYYGKRGERINNTYGYFKEEKELTSAGFVKNISYKDKNDRAVLGPDGYHSIEYLWNKADEVVRISTFDTLKNLINNSDGIADIVFQKNKSGMSTRISYYNADRVLTEDVDGVAEYFYTPSRNGLYYLEEMRDASGNLVKEAITEDEFLE